MSYKEMSEWVFLLLLLSVLAWVCVKQLRYSLMLFSSRRWPAIDATVCMGSVGRVSGLKGSYAFGSFFGYGFEIQGIRYVGSFVLIGNEEHAQALQKNLAGLVMKVRYNPTDPNVSVIVDPYDSRFEGLAGRQNPDWLGQAPYLNNLQVNQK
jgi:hypothetical protein